MIQYVFDILFDILLLAIDICHGDMLALDLVACKWYVTNFIWNLGQAYH